MVKYCQVCGNASYDSAPICGNCGAKFPPKSELNSKPPVFEDNKTTNKAAKTFSKNVEEVKSSFSKKLNSIDLGFGEEIKKEPIKKPKSYDNKSIIGFKEKGSAPKDPARKFKTKVSESEIFEEIVPKETKKNERIIPKKETKEPKIFNKETKEPKIFIKETKEPKIFSKETKEPKIEIKKSNIETKGNSTKTIAIIAIVGLILVAIVGASILTMNNHSSSQNLYYSDDSISFYYPGSWSMYNNTDDTIGGEIAFKTPDHILIGYTTIANDNIDLKTITKQINQTAASLGGSIVNHNNITINGENATDITISSMDHGYSRYISIVHNGVYYSFVINNGKTKDINDMSTLNTTDIQNMINSIKFN